MVTKLSILVATVSSRKSLLTRLLWTLEPQLNSHAEVIIHTSDTLPMGDKFNELYARANGNLAVQVDDDDLVPADYVDTVLTCAVKGADYVGHNILYTVNGIYQETYISDPRNASHIPYGANPKVRHVTPKCPVDTHEARKHLFGNHFSTDYDWVKALISGGYPYNPAFVDKVLYHYDCWPEHTLGTTPPHTTPQRDVGWWPYDEHNFKWLM